MMKIGLFSDTFYPEINGVATSCFNLQRELTRRGHEVHVFAPKCKGWEEHQRETAGYDPARFRIQTDFSSNETVFSADTLVTDWSNVGYEYALATKKPALFINTPRKIVNDAWTEADVEKYFFRKLVQDGVHVKIESNRED